MPLENIYKEAYHSCQLKRSFLISVAPSIYGTTQE